MRHEEPFLEMEEEVHASFRHENRKKRKLLQERDRSKYKKTDQKGEKEAPPFFPNEKLEKGRVLSLTKEGYVVLLPNGNSILCSIKGALLKEQGKEKNLVAVGDIVYFEKVSEKEGAIYQVERRSSFLSRSDPIHNRKEHFIVANIDQIFIVSSVLLPKLNPSLIDRYLIAAWKGNIQPIILINKVDLLISPPPYIADKEKEEEEALLNEFLKAYSPLQIPILLVSAVQQESVIPLKKMMEGKTSAFTGKSGVGKSSLLSLLFDLELPTKEVVQKTKKGAHATTTPLLIPIEGGGFCIDTPGIKSFGLWNLQPEEIAPYFPEFLTFAKKCKFLDCKHINEPICGVKEALEEGTLHPLRYHSYLSLLEHRSLEEWE